MYNGILTKGRYEGKLPKRNPTPPGGWGGWGGFFLRIFWAFLEPTGKYCKCITWSSRASWDPTLCATMSTICVICSLFMGKTHDFKATTIQISCWGSQHRLEFVGSVVCPRPWQVWICNRWYSNPWSQQKNGFLGSATRSENIPSQWIWIRNHCILSTCVATKSDRTPQDFM